MPLLSGNSPNDGPLVVAHPVPSDDEFFDVDTNDDSGTIVITTNRNHGTVTWFRGKDNRIVVLEHTEWI